VTEATEQHRGSNGRKRAAEPARGQPASEEHTGAALFPHVVWAHYEWERRLHRDGVADPTLEQAYRTKLAEFQHDQGKVDQVYWSTKSASAVAITVKRGKRPRADLLKIKERDDVVRFHRVTDWATADTPLVGEMLSECDLLAGRAEQVLRGTSERIAMRWILGIAMHLLGFLERATPPADGGGTSEREFVDAQRARLAEAEAYYQRAASQAGRIVYVSGMLLGLLLIAISGGVAAWLLSKTNTSSHHRNLALLCYGAGAIGALVSAISRMGNPEGGKFNIDFELGRPLVRRLGVFRPFVGGIFGVALFALLASGLLDLKPSSGFEPYYYGVAAFLAGFSERFATGMLGAAEGRLAPNAGKSQQATAGDTDAL
jgi:hypothetical protein